MIFRSWKRLGVVYDNFARTYFQIMQIFRFVNIGDFFVHWYGYCLTKKRSRLGFLRNTFIDTFDSDGNQLSLQHCALGYDNRGNSSLFMSHF